MRAVMRHVRICSHHVCAHLHVRARLRFVRRVLRDMCTSMHHAHTLLHNILAMGRHVRMCRNILRSRHWTLRLLREVFVSLETPYEVTTPPI